MNTFTLALHDTTHFEQIENVASFVGEDYEGSFGILAEHARFITVLKMGLARFRLIEKWTFIACPKAVLYFNQNLLTINTRHYLLGDFLTIKEKLETQILREEEQLKAMKKSLHQMEEAALKRLWELSKEDIF